MVYRTPLVDLEELCLKCRDPKARDYIQEAVSCYKAGAFRASIVSTYTAVLYDLIDKFRDLALSGDNEAKTQYEAFERATESGDLAASMKFEKDILDIAHDKFQFFSKNELLDLKRIKEDRNRCAHPSITMDGNVFYPNGALARNHVRIAIEVLLQHKAAQGKAALEGIIQTIESDYFPLNKDEVAQTFEQTALKNGRDSLIRNFTIICLKKVLKENLNFPKGKNFYNALNFISNNNHEVYTKTLQSKLNEIARSVPDDDIGKIIRFLDLTKTTDEFLESDNTVKINTFISRAKITKFDIESALDVPSLKPTAQTRIKRLNIDEIASLFLATSNEVFDRTIELYGKSKSYDEANKIGNVILSCFWTFDINQAKTIIELANKNSQIEGSNCYKKLLEKFKTEKGIDKQELQKLL